MRQAIGHRCADGQQAHPAGRFVLGSGHRGQEVWPHWCSPTTCHTHKQHVDSRHPQGDRPLVSKPQVQSQVWTLRVPSFCFSHRVASGTGERSCWFDSCTHTSRPDSTKLLVFDPCLRSDGS